MKSFKEYLTESKSGAFEIPTTKAKEYKAELTKAGHTVEVADDEGLTIKTTNVPALKKWLLSKGWDKEDLKAIF
jgi:hypothetical protein